MAEVRKTNVTHSCFGQGLPGNLMFPGDTTRGWFGETAVSLKPIWATQQMPGCSVLHIRLVKAMFLDPVLIKKTEKQTSKQEQKFKHHYI